MILTSSTILPVYLQTTRAGVAYSTCFFFPNPFSSKSFPPLPHSLSPFYFSLFLNSLHGSLSLWIFKVGALFTNSLFNAAYIHNLLAGFKGFWLWIKQGRLNCCFLRWACVSPSAVLLLKSACSLFLQSLRAGMAHLYRQNTCFIQVMYHSFDAPGWSGCSWVIRLT